MSKIRIRIRKIGIRIRISIGKISIRIMIRISKIGIRIRPVGESRAPTDAR
jgi:hypothetical protein